MTRYAASIIRRAQTNLAAVPADTYQRIKDELVALGDDPRPRGSKKLRGRKGFRIRIGDYHIVYEVDDAKKIVTILDVGHRREIYR